MWYGRCMVDMISRSIIAGQSWSFYVIEVYMYERPYFIDQINFYFSVYYLVSSPRYFLYYSLWLGSKRASGRDLEHFTGLFQF